MAPSWEQREAQDNEDLEQRMDQLGQQEGLRESWSEWEGDGPGMLDGRPGIDPAYAPQIYLWLIGAGILVVIGVIGAILKAFVPHYCHAARLSSSTP